MTMEASRPDLSYILNHLGEDRSQYFNAVSPPIIQSSNFAFPTLDAFREAYADEVNHHIYTRGNNPTTEILRKKLAALEYAEDALVFSSGSGAISSAILAFLSAGDHVVCVQSPYSWTKNLLLEYLPRFGITHTFVDARDPAHVEAAIQPNTRVLYLESPNSMTFEMQDLEACAAIARKHGVISMIDNSHATPLYQNPIRLGIDLSIHTGTKYLNGHSDVVMGAICGTKEHIRHIFHSETMTRGNILSPHDAFLTLKGLRTLELRVQRSHDSGLVVAQYLEQHPKVERVIHPWLPSFPQYELARKQMRGAGGLFSIYLKTQDISAVERFFHQLKAFLLAVSWGGHESLVLPSVAFYKVKGKPDSTQPPNLVRIYVGLEDPHYLIRDLEQALEVL